MGIIRNLSLLLLLTAPVFAQDLPNLHCSSTSPTWALDLYQEDAQFRFADRTIDYDIVDQTEGQPGPWPIGLTLLSRDDTSIVLLRGGSDYTVDILTQRRGLPVILSGTCVTWG